MADDKALARNTYESLITAYSAWKAAYTLAASDPTAEAQASRHWKKVTMLRALLADFGYSLTDEELAKDGLRRFHQKYAEKLGTSWSAPAKAKTIKGNRPPPVPKEAMPPMVNGDTVDTVKAAASLRAPAEPTRKSIDGKRLKYDFEYFCQVALTIDYRPGVHQGNLRRGPFIFNSAQRKLVALVVDLLFIKKVPLRLIILKARQLGCTTLFLALYLWLAICHDGWRQMIIIDKGAHVINKRRLIMDWVNELPDKIGEYWQGSLPVIISREGDQIVLSNHSVFMFETANADNPGTSEKLDGEHESEKPKWKAGSQAVIRDSILPGLPWAPLTTYVNESTALGIEFFHDEYQAACRADAGEMVALPVFLPWFISPEYCLPEVDGFRYRDNDEKLGDTNDINGEWIPESVYARTYGLSQGQVLWRRSMILDTYKGNRAAFDQEYPTTERHAFRKSGLNYFPTYLLQLLKPARVIETGTLYDVLGSKVRQGLQYTDVKPAVKPDPSGMLRIYEYPDRRYRYFIGGDVASGKAALNNEGEYDSDSTVFHVLRHDGVLVARFGGKIRPEDAWYPLLLLAVYYNEALVNCERSPHGETLLTWFWETSYPNNVVEPLRGESSRRPVKDRMWTVVTQGNRDQLLDDFRASVIAHPEKVTDVALIEEMRTFIVHPSTAKAQAASGCHDDDIFAGAHAEFARISELGRVEASNNGPRRMEEVVEMSERQIPTEGRSEFFYSEQDFDQDLFGHREETTYGY